ncbi:Uncharacterised protein [Mycobacteroides abscessus subsp. abscessus]|nr:Uncharacterised protein [Mycobacteroides abscessus subsp. abscessus]
MPAASSAGSSVGPNSVAVLLHVPWTRITGRYCVAPAACPAPSGEVTACCGSSTTSVDPEEDAPVDIADNACPPVEVAVLFPAGLTVVTPVRSVFTATALSGFS